MTEVYLAAYDGSPGSRRAVDFALRLAALSGGSLVVVHVLAWSPYSFLTKEEIEERHRRRAQELDRAEKAILKPLVDEIAAGGVEVTTATRFGHIAESICALAVERGATQIVIGRSGESSAISRLFGSTAASLAQIAPVPCTIVP